MANKKSIVDDELEKVTGEINPDELDENDDTEENEKSLRVLKRKL